jgi:hypothetical protein
MGQKTKDTARVNNFVREGRILRRQTEGYFEGARSLTVLSSSVVVVKFVTIAPAIKVNVRLGLGLGFSVRVQVRVVRVLGCRGFGVCVQRAKMRIFARLGFEG